MTSTPDTRFLRPLKAEETFKLYNSINELPTPEIRSFDRVRLLPPQPEPDSLRGCPGYIFEDTVYAVCLQPCQPGQPSQKSFNTCVYGGIIRSIWGHFITESLARLWAVVNNLLPQFDHIIFFAENRSANSLNDLPANFREIFTLLGIQDKIVICNSPVEVNKLIVPDLGAEHNLFFTSIQASVYHAITSAALHRPPSPDIHFSDRIFLSRLSKKQAAVNEINLPQLEKYLTDNSFSIIDPVSTPITDLIHLFRHARLIGSTSGSLAHNFAFIPHSQAATSFILERHPWVNSFQLNLNKMLRLSPIFVDTSYLPTPAPADGLVMLYAPTPQFREFATELGLSADGVFAGSSLTVRRRELHRFLRRHRRYSCSGNRVHSWEADCGRAIIEALVASNERYAPWLSGHLPVLWFDYLNIPALYRLLRATLKKS